jgi:hypothetical protein
MDMEGLDLTKLMGGPGLTINSQIALNRIAVTLYTLLDTGANSYAIVHSNLASNLLRTLGAPILKLPRPYRIRGFNSIIRKTTAHYIRAHLSVAGRRIWKVPFIILDISQHDLILGRHFFHLH